MGTEVAISFSTLQAQLENEKSNLCKIHENIKKIVQNNGRYSDRFISSGDYPRGGNRPGGRSTFLDGWNTTKLEDQFGKRKHETKTVFSRLFARNYDSDGEDDGPFKRARVTSTVCRELPTRAEVLRAQGDDERARTRNRRIFGSLLGTLQKFKQEEIVLQTKEDKKAQVERKIEEQARLQREKEHKERKSLYAERDHKKATIKALEAKMGRVQEFETWEASQKNLQNFILTKCKPHLYWLPKKMSEKAEEKFISSRKCHEKYMKEKREELQDELYRIEQRCFRYRAPFAKENEPDAPPKKPAPTAQDVETKEGRKRDKFATDADVKDDSDADDRHEDETSNTNDTPVEIKEEKEPESKADTNIEKDEPCMGTEPVGGDAHDAQKHKPETTQEAATQP